MLNRIGLVSIALFMFLMLFSKIDFITADGTGPAYTFNTSFEMNEYSSFNASHQNVNSFNITLPSSSWSIQDVELNFTDIKFGIENNTIEDKQYGQSYEIYHQNGIFKRFCVGAQIQLNVSTTIYGAYFYANMSAPTVEIIQVQLRGYDYVHLNYPFH